MTRIGFSLATLGLIGGLGALPFGTAPANAADESSWVGAAVMNGGKGYTPTPLGQVHYRDLGKGGGETGAPLLLLHQSPWSLVQFAEVQNILAPRGVRSIAVDTPGYGLSDTPAAPPTMADYADNLVAVLDHLKIAKVTLAGHHTGAAIAVAFAARHPDRVNALILHGVPFYTAEERAERLKRPHKNYNLRPDAGQITDYFQSVRKMTGMEPENLKNVTWSTVTVLLAGQTEWYGHVAAFSYDMAPDLVKIKAPTLVLSDSGDVLHAMDEKTVKLRPDFSYRQFSTGESHSLMNDPTGWADIVAAFARTHASSRATVR